MPKAVKIGCAGDDKKGNELSGHWRKERDGTGTQFVHSSNSWVSAEIRLLSILELVR